MKRETLGRFTLLGTLYFAQGLPFGFFVQALPVLLRDAGYSLGAIGLSSLLTLPWALKFVWAPIVDRKWWPRVGRRRSWILAMQLAGTVVLTLIAITPGSEAIAVLMTSMVVLNLIAATQDIATDGMAVEMLPEAERGFANGLQVAGYRVGMVVGGGVLLGVVTELGIHGLFGVMAALTAVATIPVLFAREPKTTLPPLGAAPAVHFLKLPGAWRLIALVVVYKAGESFASTMLKPFLRDHGMSLEDIAWLIGTVGFLAGMAGALAGGALVTVLGRRRSLIVFGIFQVIAVAGYAYLAFGTPTKGEFYAWAAVEHFASGTATASLFTAMMDWSRPSSSGTDYTVQASAVVIATGVAATLSGFSAEALGYGLHFVAATVLCAIAVGVIVWLFPKQPFLATSSQA
jgi:PAT family beta-lactamase induction signal transducer AmpG